MYDNLDLTLTRENCPGVDFLSTVPQYLTRVISDGTNDYGKFITGTLDNLKVSISKTRVKISEGSLCKYFLGDNFKTLTRGDTKRAIDKISDCLNLPFDRSKVTRLDFAQNLIMKYDEKIYYPYLGQSNHYSRLEQNNGLYYQNQLRQKVFYGKVAEQKKKRQPIPEIYQDRNVLRFELRFKKKIPEQLKRNEVTGKLLYDEDFFKGLVKRLKQEYLDIHKINSKIQQMKPTGSIKELAKNFIQFQVIEIGQPQILNLITQWQKQAEITKKEASDLRQWIKKISPTGSDEDNSLITELDQKIKAAAYDY